MVQFNMTGDSDTCPMMSMPMGMTEKETTNSTATTKEEQLLIAQSMLRNATEYLNTILNQD